MVAILGPRQCGKTTLSRYIASRQKTNAITHCDLKSPVHLSQLEHPEIPAQHIRRAWMMMEHYHGQTINYSELSRSLDISDTTLKLHQQTKLDLLIFDGSNFKGFEFKFSDNPTLTPSMATAISTLGLKQLTVITPHHQSWALSENINVIGLEEFIKMQTSFY